MNEENMCESAKTSKKISQTEQQLEKARSAKDMLFDTIALLAERLKSALRQQDPLKNSECVKEEKLTEIAEAFKGLREDFSFANSQLRDLIERLEI